MDDPILECTNLVKRYAKPVVNGLSVRLYPGQLYTLLGINGAGKTTTLRMIAGIVSPDSGHVHVCGCEMAAQPEQAKQLIAYVPDEPPLYAKLTAAEHLGLVASLWDMPALESERRANELLERLGLKPFAGQRAGEFSRGMKQKLALAMALLHRPRLLMLDEPLTGLDAYASRIAKDLMSEHMGDGGAILMTTHILEVAERLSERIGILHGGRLIEEGTVAELRTRTGISAGNLEELFLELTT